MFIGTSKEAYPKVLQMQLLEDREGAITRDQYNVGDFVSVDQFICKMPGRLQTGYGRESQDCRFYGSIIFNDAASGLIWVKNQVSLGANKTVMGKVCFEQWLYDQCVCEVKNYHGDNGIISAEEFWCDCKEKQQSQSFSGIGSQHQNAHAKCAIQTIMYMAQTFMVHASLDWTERGSDNLSLWSFAVKHLVWVYNCVLNVRLGLTPLELITRERSDYKDLLCCHVWGCPVFVLEAKLQNDQKLPKWNQWAKMGQFVGFSDKHSSLVANVRHLSTNFISPQFQVVFDDLFETVNRTDVDKPVIKSICQDLFQLNRDCFAEEELDKVGNIIYQPPPLHEVWLDKAGQWQGNKDCIWQWHWNDNLMRDRNQAVQQIVPPPVTTDTDADDNPSMLPVSDDGSIDSSLYSWDSESEGGFWDNQYNHNVSIAPEGAQLIPPDNDGNRAPLVGLPVVCNIGPEREAAHPAPNIVPAPITAPGGATHWQRGKAKQYPPAMWQHGADGKL